MPQFYWATGLSFGFLLVFQVSLMLLKQAADLVVDEIVCAKVACV